MAEELQQSGRKVFPIFQKNYRPKENKPDPLQEIQLTLEKSQKQVKKRKTLFGKKETPGLTQMILDAGQKVIGPVYCDECGLLYTPGDIEDESEHRKAHNRIENLSSITMWKDINIVQNFPAEGCMVITVDCKTESKRVLNKLKDFLAWLDSELGGSHDQCGTTDSERIYLYAFRTKRKNVLRILGCAVVESIDNDKNKKHILSSPLANPAQSSTNVNEDSIIVAGITRLWTDPSFRRRKVATRLCDALRMTWGVPGYVLPKYKLGIVEPSEDGKAFMAKYTDGQCLQYTYVYQDNSDMSIDGIL